jgi:hypothetical protein
MRQWWGWRLVNHVDYDMWQSCQPVVRHVADA